VHNMRKIKRVVLALQGCRSQVAGRRLQVAGRRSNVVPLFYVSGLDGGNLA
jgi:hypothetical protein